MNEFREWQINPLGVRGLSFYNGNRELKSDESRATRQRRWCDRFLSRDESRNQKTLRVREISDGIFPDLRQGEMAERE